MPVILADRKHSRNDPRRMSLRKIMLSFGAIISVTCFKNEGNTPKGSTHISRSRRRHGKTEVRKATELHLNWGKQDIGVTNCSRHCLLSNWEPRSEAYSAGATTKPPPGPMRVGIKGFTRKIELFSVSHHLCEQVKCFRVLFLVSSTCDSLAAP